MAPSVFLLLAAGFVALVLGAELLVRGASRLAALLGISPLVVGLTVVAFGTSAPELAVSVQAAFAGQAGIALGNAVGSNIFNVLLILGLSAVVAPLSVSQKLLRFEVPLMIGASSLAILFSLDHRLGRFEGSLLFGGILAYTIFVVRQSRRESRAIQEEYAAEFGPPPGGRHLGIQLALVGAGLGLLVLGSRWLVESSTTIARALGVSDLVIGLTIIAAGTSLPELATSILASIRGERDIAVGNVVGSNLFNLLAVLGVTAILAPAGVPVPPEALAFDLPVMAAVALACLPVFFTGSRIGRGEGVLFVAYYALYVAFLALAATESVFRSPLATAVLVFVLPLTVITLGVITLAEVRARRRARGG